MAPAPTRMVKLHRRACYEDQYGNTWGWCMGSAAKWGIAMGALIGVFMMALVIAVVVQHRRMRRMYDATSPPAPRPPRQDQEWVKPPSDPPPEPEQELEFLYPPPPGPPPPAYAPNAKSP